MKGEIGRWKEEEMPDVAAGYQRPVRPLTHRSVETAVDDTAQGRPYRASDNVSLRH